MIGATVHCQPPAAGLRALPETCAASQTMKQIDRKIEQSLSADRISHGGRRAIRPDPPRRRQGRQQGHDPSVRWSLRSTGIQDGDPSTVPSAYPSSSCVVPVPRLPRSAFRVTKAPSSP